MGKEGKERKERVIHTRIPTGLEDDLKKLADALRMPVSNLVRNILDDTMVAVDSLKGTVEELVGDVTSRVNNETEQLRHIWIKYQTGRRGFPYDDVPTSASEKPPKDPLDDVFGFQPLILNVAATCASCGRELPRGAEAHVGLTDRPGRRLFVCDDCLPTLEV